MIPRLNKDSPLCPHVNMTDSTKTMSHTPWMGWGGGGGSIKLQFYVSY